MKTILNAFTLVVVLISVSNAFGDDESSEKFRNTEPKKELPFEGIGDVNGDGKIVCKPYDGTTYPYALVKVDVKNLRAVAFPGNSLKDKTRIALKFTKKDLYHNFVFEIPDDMGILVVSPGLTDATREGAYEGSRRWFRCDDN